jgi:hypothetical protein
LIKADPTGSELTPITIGIVEVALLDCVNAGRVRHEHVGIEPYQLDGKLGKALFASIRPAILDDDIPPLVVPEFARPRRNASTVRRVVRWRSQP